MGDVKSGSMGWLFCVCVCVYLCAQVAVESHPRLICRHCCATAAGVPVPGRSQAASFSQENAFNQSWVTAKQRRHLRNARNVPHHQRADLDIFISAIKKGTMRGKGGSKCKDRPRKEGMRVGIEGRGGMSAPAMAACAAKEKMAPRRMMKYDSTPPPELLLINPFIKKGTTPLNPHFASGCNCWGEHLARSRDRKDTRDLKPV